MTMNTTPTPTPSGKETPTDTSVAGTIENFRGMAKVAECFNDTEGSAAEYRARADAIEFLTARLSQAEKELSEAKEEISGLHDLNGDRLIRIASLEDDLFNARRQRDLFMNNANNAIGVITKAERTRDALRARAELADELAEAATAAKGTLSSAASAFDNQGNELMANACLKRLELLDAALAKARRHEKRRQVRNQMSQHLP